MAVHQRREVEAILAGARAEHRALLEHVSPALRASLPVDATGVTQAIAHVAGVVGIEEEVAGEQRRGHRANPAVLHGRVFGREPLSPETVIAAFVDGARVRAAALERLADEIGGPSLAAEVAGLLAAARVGEASGADAVAAVRDQQAAQEQALLLLADAL